MLTTGLILLVWWGLALAAWPTILLSRKQPVVMLAWLLGVTFVPILGPLFFVVFGRQRRLPGLPRKKLRSDRVFRLRQDGKIPSGTLPEDRRMRVPHNLRACLNVAEKVGSYGLSDGNRLELLDGAEEKYRRLIRDIQAAQHHVHLEYFILKDDTFGNHLADVLRERAGAGIQVRLLVDGVGSMWLSRRYIRQLREAGVRFVWFHPLNPLKGRWSLNLRNHRKIAVIDGRTGYLGGINLADEYLGRDPYAGQWHDLSLRLAGPAVHSMQQVFLEDWHFSTGEVLGGDPWFPPLDPEESGSAVQIVNSTPSDEVVTEMHQIYFAMFAASRRQAWLMTPYFLPDETFQTALANLALRGVDVRVVVPQHTPDRIVDIASRSFFAPLLEVGVRIFWFRPDATLHAKALLVDQALMVIGSANMDQRSFRINFESGALIYNEDFAGRLQAYFEEKMEQSNELTLERFQRRAWSSRALESMARLAAPLF